MVPQSCPEFERVIAKTALFDRHSEREGNVLGSAFVDERGVIAGIGPVTVDPDVQDVGVGRALKIGRAHV